MSVLHLTDDAIHSVLTAALVEPGRYTCKITSVSTRISNGVTTIVVTWTDPAVGRTLLREHLDVAGNADVLRLRRGLTRLRDILRAGGRDPRIDVNAPGSALLGILASLTIGHDSYQTKAGETVTKATVLAVEPVVVDGIEDLL